MSQTDILEEIKKYKDAVLAACAGAYLHNLGKVSSEFNLDHQKLLKEKERKKYYFYQHIASLLKIDSEKAGLSINDDYFIAKKSINYFNTEDDLTEKVFERIRDILGKGIVAGGNKLFSPFDDCDYRWGDFMEYLGQGADDARLYFNKDVKKYKDHENRIKITGTGSSYYIECLRGTSSLLTHLMNRCHHGASGGEKDKFHFLKQKNNLPAFMATPFGFEIKNADENYSEYNDLRKNAEASIKDNLDSDKLKSDGLKLNNFINSLKPIFQEAMADSQRPFNNISVHDIGHSGMALLKAALWTLKGKELTHDSFWTDEGKWLRWRLLCFSLDGLSFLSEAVSIADLRVRKAKLEKYRCTIKGLLEEKYPVATEVYHDENSSIFIFPNWDENSSEAKSIMQLIDTNYDLCGEERREKTLAEVYGLEPRRQISSKSYMAHPGDAREREETYIGAEMQKMILNPLPTVPVPGSFYPDSSAAKPERDLCPYCGLRLISKDGEARKTCSVCLDERSGVARDWWESKRQDTIWLEEIADKHGRLALVVGRFFPERFLELDYLPCRGENKFGDKMLSAEAFARQRRIWETCREFWSSAEEDIRASILSDHAENRERLHIEVPTTKANGYSGLEKPKKYHAYELLIDGLSLTAMWAGESFVTLENLQGFSIRNRLTEDAGKWLEKQKAKPVTIRIQGGYGSKTKVLGHTYLGKVEKDDNGYLPVMPILREPRTFMFLVPAGKAFAIAKNIKSKYEKEMGQVGGRLPLHLGLVYSNRYTPLRAVLDAGRRMLEQRAEAVRGVLLNTPEKDKKEERWQFSWKLDEESAPICWSVAHKVPGDSTTMDEWYPFFPVCELVERGEESAVLDLKPKARVFSAGSDQEIKQMIHVEKLCKGDQVYLYPSTFDFEYLDSAGTRFEIAYEGRKRKSSDRAQRAYLLEQIDELDEIWDVLKTGVLKRNQIYALRDAINSKRYEWEQPFNRPDESFKRFCRDMLVTAAWNKVVLEEQEKKVFPLGKDRHETFFDQWADYAARGLFEDVVELFLQIMKEKLE